LIYILNSNDTSKQEVLELRESYLDFLIEHLLKRLCHSGTEVLDASSLHEPNVAVSITREERANVLHAHFKICISHPNAKQNRTTQILNMTSPLTWVNLKNVTARKKWLSVMMKSYAIWLNMWMVN